ncbi:cytochrome c oxidase assembly factor CtaG [Cohnella lubricantis]|uniref:Cytochrome c oxidase assembly factor CtaG n=1 Tax=Cohnella lubricantis TaxID=2163172 RepID=A0A841T929_9BACL|nr:cytochrome c oxidase assembly factor CtaG [Cohnella lubricantis]MBB6675750.1 cytochrome c oxidase assembly factor CtaG [Cohnella lubricantis]MBP2118894.1 putative membrane protein [Cohnella lubricantis]
MMGLQYFSFAELWSPYFLVFMLAVATLYSFVVGPWRGRFAGAEPVPVGRQLTFYLAMALLYFAQGGPLSLLAHLMFTFHMTDMAVSYILVPPMLLAGIPAWLWRAIFRPRFWKPFKFMTNPIFGLLLFNLLFSFYHIPSIHDWIMVHYVLHGIFYAVLLGAAMLNWWHTRCPVPEWAALSSLKRLGYIFLNSLLLTPACVMIIFASTAMFAVYNDPEVWATAMRYCVSGNTAELLAQFKGPAFFNLMDAREDQQLGGIVMKLLQEFINIWALFTVFMEWYRRERAQEDDPAFDHAASGQLNNV